MTGEPPNISEQVKPALQEPAAHRRSAHLVCRSGWALVATAACGYFAYVSCSALRDGNFEWQHPLWNSLTWAVWLVLAIFMLTETRCWLERILFILLFLIFAIGLVFSLWSSADLSLVREARIAALALWSLATVAGLISIVAPAGREANGQV